MAKIGVVAARDREENEVRDPDDSVRSREEKCRVLERARDAEGDDEERRHRRKDRNANRSLFRIDHARQPGVARP
jgi:hypothetical protein